MSSKKLNKWISVIGAVTVAVAGFSGCGGSGSGETKETSKNKTEAEAEFTPALDTDSAGTLSVAGFMGNFEALDQVVNNFNEYYPNITVSYEQNGSTQLVDYLENNEYVDIFMTAAGNLSDENNKEMYAADYCLDLSKENIDVSAIKDEMVDACMTDGKLLRIPLAENTFGMVVNKTLLENEGLDVPTDYKEFQEVLKQLKEKGYNPIQGSSIHVYSEITANMAYTQIGTDKELCEKLNNKDSEAAEELRPVMEKLDDIIRNQYTDYSVNETYPLDNYDQAILRFFEGDVPFWICSTECVSGMKKRESKSETFTENPFDYQFLFIPVGEKGAYEYIEPWYGFSINKNSENKDYAVEFLRFLSTEEQINIMGSVKGMPSVAKNSSDERYTGILDQDLIEDSYMDKGEINNSVKNCIADVSNQFGSGAYSNLDEAMEALKERISQQ